MRSSSTSTSSSLNKDGSIFSVLISNLPLSVTCTRPPPAWPVASRPAISSCMAWNLACISFALPIRPSKSFMAFSWSAVVFLDNRPRRGCQIVVGNLGCGREPNVDDARSGEARQDRCHGRIGGGIGDGGLPPACFLFGERRAAVLARHRNDPAPPGPCLQIGVQVGNERFRGIGSEADFEAAIVDAHRTDA